jgi:hypothetical protein
LKVILFFFSFNHVADKSLEVKPYQEKQKVFGMIYCFEPHEEEEEAEKENESNPYKPQNLEFCLLRKYHQPIIIFKQNNKPNIIFQTTCNSFV